MNAEPGATTMSLANASNGDPKMSVKSEYLTIREPAKSFRVVKRTVYALTRQGNSRP